MKIRSVCVCNRRFSSSAPCVAATAEINAAIVWHQENRSILGPRCGKVGWAITLITETGPALQREGTNILFVQVHVCRCDLLVRNEAKDGKGQGTILLDELLRSF